MTGTVSDINAQYSAQFDGQYELVFGDGNPHATLMLIGEAPGAQEVVEKRPFVGAAGKNLQAFLDGVHLVRSDLYITNAVKFRPAKLGTSGRLSNRPPTRAEVAAFRPWLLDEIDCIKPKVIATLGNTPLAAVTGDSLTIGDVHGRPLPASGAYIIFPLYHPASIIYRRELKPIYEADIKALGQFIAGLSTMAVEKD